MGCCSSADTGSAAPHGNKATSPRYPSPRVRTINATPCEPECVVVNGKARTTVVVDVQDDMMDGAAPATDANSAAPTAAGTVDKANRILAFTMALFPGGDAGGDGVDMSPASEDRRVGDRESYRAAPHGERRPPALSTGDDHSQLPSVTSVVLHDAVGPRPESSGRGPSSPLNSANSRLSRRSASVLRYRPQGSSSSLSLAECALGLPASPIVSFVEPASTNASPLPFPLTQLSAAPRATPRMVRPN